MEQAQEVVLLSIQTLLLDLSFTSRISGAGVQPVEVMLRRLRLIGAVTEAG